MHGTFSTPEQLECVFLCSFLSPISLWACTVFSWYPTQQTVAKGVPWNCECLGLSPGPGKFAIPLNVSMCSLCRTRCRAGRELLCSGLSSFLFALPLGIYCPFDRNCEEDCHHLETPPRQGLILFFLTFLGALKSRGSVHVTWWYPVDHWTWTFPVVSSGSFSLEVTEIARLCDPLKSAVSNWFALYQYSPSFFFFLASLCGMRILVPQPGIDSLPPALGARSLNHQTIREVCLLAFLISSLTSKPSLCWPHYQLPHGL